MEMGIIMYIKPEYIIILAVFLVVLLAAASLGWYHLYQQLRGEDMPLGEQKRQPDEAEAEETSQNDFWELVEDTEEKEAESCFRTDLFWELCVPLKEMLAAEEKILKAGNLIDAKKEALEAKKAGEDLLSLMAARLVPEENIDRIREELEAGKEAEQKSEEPEAVKEVEQEPKEPEVVKEEECEAGKQLLAITVEELEERLERISGLIEDYEDEEAVGELKDLLNYNMEIYPASLVKDTMDSLNRLDYAQAAERIKNRRSKFNEEDIISRR